MEAERQQALEAAKREEEMKKSRGAQSLQALQEQMAERTAAQAGLQVTKIGSFQILAYLREDR